MASNPLHFQVNDFQNDGHILQLGQQQEAQGGDCVQRIYVFVLHIYHFITLLFLAYKRFRLLRQYIPVPAGETDNERGADDDLELGNIGPDN